MRHKFVNLVLLSLFLEINYVLWMSINLMNENGFILKKKKKRKRRRERERARSRQYPTETITDADFADDLELLTNIYSSWITAA